MARKNTHTNEDQEVEAQWKVVEEEEEEQELPPRRDLLIEAIKIIRAALKNEGTPSRTTVGNLVQLLKLHKELIEEEEKPATIQLIWNELDAEYYEDV